VWTPRASLLSGRWRLSLERGFRRCLAVSAALPECPRPARPLQPRSSSTRTAPDPECLALLAAAEERVVTRDKPLACLWAVRNTDRARHALSPTLDAVRQDLGNQAGARHVPGFRGRWAVGAATGAKSHRASRRRWALARRWRCRVGVD